MRAEPAPAAGRPGRLLLACTRRAGRLRRAAGPGGRRAGREDPLPRPLRVFRVSTRRVPLPGRASEPPNNERILRLAAAASDRGRVSSRQELYPRGMARAGARSSAGGACRPEAATDRRAGARRAHRGAATPRPSRCPTGPSWTTCSRGRPRTSTWDATTSAAGRRAPSPHTAGRRRVCRPPPARRRRAGQPGR